jgi:hypothetical protein
MSPMKNAFDKKYLESAAHAYVATSKRFADTEEREDQRNKNLARIKLQTEALRYAADFMEHFTGLMLDGGDRLRACKPGIDQLREIVMDSERILEQMNER